MIPHLILFLGLLAATVHPQFFDDVTTTTRSTTTRFTVTIPTSTISSGLGSNSTTFPDLPPAYGCVLIDSNVPIASLDPSFVFTNTTQTPQKCRDYCRKNGPDPALAKGFFIGPTFNGLLSLTKFRCLCDNRPVKPYEVTLLPNGSSSCDVKCFGGGGFCGGINNLYGVVAWTGYLDHLESPGNDTTKTTTTTVNFGWEIDEPTTTVNQATQVPIVHQPTIRASIQQTTSNNIQPQPTDSLVIPLTTNNISQDPTETSTDPITITDSSGNIATQNPNSSQIPAKPNPHPPGPPQPPSASPTARGGPNHDRLADSALLGSLIGGGLVLLVSFIIVVQVSKRTKPHGTEESSGDSTRNDEFQEPRVVVFGGEAGMPRLIGLGGFGTRGGDEIGGEDHGEIVEHLMFEDSGEEDDDDGPFRYVTPDPDEIAVVGVAPPGMKVRDSQDAQRKVYEAGVTGGYGKSSGGVGSAQNPSTASNLGGMTPPAVILGAMSSDLKKGLAADEYSTPLVGFGKFQQSWFSDPNVLRAGAIASPSTVRRRVAGTIVSKPVASIRSRNSNIQNKTRNRLSYTSSSRYSTSFAVKRSVKSDVDSSRESIFSHLSGDASGSQHDVFVNTSVAAPLSKRRRNASSLYMHLLADNE
ncbi:hypothetical protein HDU79_002554 [Rhizoclosmatium sp. JEL0117]|nr:hypothetical protein HDU79_002554 [Rhizoclosmatium sp. JEL0117]